MSSCFTYVGPSSIFQHLTTLVRDTQDWKPYYNFTVTEVPNEMVLKDPVLKKLHDFFPFKAGICLMDGFRVYNWHTDDKRKCSINMLLGHAGSFCLFKNNVESKEVVEPATMLDYQMGHYYLFNTQIPHMIYNDSGYRYLFTLEFLDEDVTYEKVLDNLTLYSI